MCGCAVLRDTIHYVTVVHASCSVSRSVTLSTYSARYVFQTERSREGMCREVAKAALQANDANGRKESKNCERWRVSRGRGRGPAIDSTYGFESKNLYQSCAMLFQLIDLGKVGLRYRFRCLIN